MSARQRRWSALCLGAATATLFATVGTGPAGAAEAAVGGDARGTVIGAGQPDAIKGQYIVALRGAPSVAAETRAAVAARADELTDAHGGTVRTVYAAAFRGFSLQATEAQAARLAASPDVRYVQTNNIVRAVGTQPNPPSWGLDAVDGKQDKTYTYPNQGDGVTAYVVDTGTDLRHSNFEGRASSGYDFIDNDADASDCQGHGTHVAGTIGSKDYGVAKQAKLVAVRVLDCSGNGSTEQVVGGLEWVTKNAAKPAVANMSLGGPSDQALDDATQGTIDAGVPVAVAAGNDYGQDACGTSPARLPAAITLGSTDQNGSRSGFSNVGRCLDLFAPGGNITSTKNGGGSTGMSGTSMATPHAAGAAALYLSSNKNATPQQVRDALVNSADSGVVTNPGSGSPNKLLNVSKLGTPAEPGAPTAEFAASCSESALSCEFDGSASRDADGSIAGYVWDFGDGTAAKGVKPAHTYAKAGSYEVRLTVTDDSGKTGTVSKKVSVGAPAGEPPVAQFSVSCWYDACDFNAGQSTDKEGDIASYAWKFGDGQTGTGVTAKHTYPAGQKTYTAELTVTDRAGNAGTATRQIQCWDMGGRAFCFNG
ncbi:S8 family serine peptidase [Streptomyces sp. AC536]|uniref:S8 family serine peptidase n=1 Tax=Streptomyces buecherae TaxID=2763006 RepID=UPI00164EBB0D|nr:S8 family serine peptidase [Streptomyces buecherae]MBC3983887.1 S8 family serine peptidase [Streptomyces buecherae]QNJ42412.1 S8 family serine peptidase [Streptomyces buecherae]